MIGDGHEPLPSTVRLAGAVHYVLAGADVKGRSQLETGSCRAATVVRVWPTSVNLLVFLDGLNDVERDERGPVPTLLWRQGVRCSARKTPGTFHFACGERS